MAGQRPEGVREGGGDDRPPPVQIPGQDTLFGDAEEMSDEPEVVSTAALCERSGVSYRQANYWTTMRWLRPVTAANPGSGFARRYPPVEVEVAATIQRLRDAGVEVEVAVRVARQVAGAAGPVSVPLGDGVVLTVTPGVGEGRGGLEPGALGREANAPPAADPDVAVAHNGP